MGGHDKSRFLVSRKTAFSERKRLLIEREPWQEPSLQHPLVTTRIEVPGTVRRIPIPSKWAPAGALVTPQSQSSLYAPILLTKE